MYEAMSSGFAQDLAQRTCSFALFRGCFLDKVYRSLMRLRHLSFAFSYVNKGYDALIFVALGSWVLSIPSGAITPGVGIFFTQFNGCISLTLLSWKGSYLSKKQIYL